MRVRLHRLSKARVALLALWAFAVLGPALGGGLWGLAAFWLLAPLAVRYLVWPVIRRPRR